MPHLLASDLDGTLIALERGPGRRRAAAAFRAAVEASTDSVVVAYVTGRHLELALEGVADAGLPLPAFFACDVGTSIYARKGKRWVPDQGFQAEMREAMGGGDADTVRACLEEVDALALQDEDSQAPFKASYYMDWGDRVAVVQEATSRLAGEGVRHELVVSRDANDGRGLLDVLPAGGAKDRAVRHLASRLEISVEHVVFAGDSGNDRSALLAGWDAILVGNAPDALREEIRVEAGRRGLERRIHLSRASYVAGVMEGLEALGFPLRGS
jgi:HAD superfamily hydrolase (TIGR01484 family)